MTDHQDINQCINDLTAREDDNLWGTYDETGTLCSLHVGPEPEFSQDEGLIQINFTNMTAYDLAEIARMKSEIWLRQQ